MNARRLAASIALFLAGCAGSDGRNYPSLAKRAVENQAVAAPAATDAGAVASYPLARVEDLLKQARSSEAAFAALDTRTLAQIRAGAGAQVSSEAWVVAQLALARLEGERNGAVSALAELDTIYADRMLVEAQGGDNGGSDAVERVRREVLRIVDAQNDRLDALKALLKTP